MGGFRASKKDIEGYARNVERSKISSYFDTEQAKILLGIVDRIEKLEKARKRDAKKLEIRLRGIEERVNAAFGEKLKKDMRKAERVISQSRKRLPNSGANKGK